MNPAMMPAPSKCQGRCGLAAGPEQWDRGHVWMRKQGVNHTMNMMVVLRVDRGRSMPMSSSMSSRVVLQSWFDQFARLLQSKRIDSDSKDQQQRDRKRGAHLRRCWFLLDLVGSRMASQEPVGSRCDRSQSCLLTGQDRSLEGGVFQPRTWSHSLHQ